MALIGALIGRRGVLAAGATALVGTVAATLLIGKRPPEVLRPLTPPAEAGALRGMEAMVRTNPVRPAPALGFADAAGTARTLADYRGKGVLLNVWATWCGPCVAEMPSLVALSRGAGADGFVVLPLSVDRGGAATVRPWLDGHGAGELPALVDDRQVALATLGVRGLPTTFVIDRAGNLRGVLEGGADWATPAARAMVRELVAV